MTPQEVLILFQKVVIFFFLQLLIVLKDFDEGQAFLE
jgi:hypothetical protein